MNRRGSAVDVILIGALLFAFGLGFFFLHYTVNQVITQIVANPVVSSSPAAVAGFQASQTVAARLDYFVLAILIGLILGVIVTSWYIEAHPVFVAFYFIILVVGVVVGAGLSNAWETFSTKAAFSGSLLAFPITNNVLTYLPYYVAAIGVLAMVVLFAKPLVSGGYTGGGHL